MHTTRSPRPVCKSNYNNCVVVRECARARVDHPKCCAKCASRGLHNRTQIAGISVPHAPFSDRSGARARAQPANVLSNLREWFAYFLITANRNRAETFRPSRIHASRAIAASVIAHHVRIAHKNQCFVNDMSLNHTTTTPATAAQFPNYRNYEYNILVRLAMCTPKTCSGPRVAGLVTTSRSTHKHTRCSVARAVSCRAGTSERERSVRSR